MGLAGLTIPVVVGIPAIPVVAIRDSPVVGSLGSLGSLAGLGGRDPGPGSRLLVVRRSNGWVG